MSEKENKTSCVLIIDHDLKFSMHKKVENWQLKVCVVNALYS